MVESLSHAQLSGPRGPQPSRLLCPSEEHRERKVNRNTQSQETVSSRVGGQVLLGRNTATNLHSISESRDIALPTKVHLVRL